MSLHSLSLPRISHSGTPLYLLLRTETKSESAFGIFSKLSETSFRHFQLRQFHIFDLKRSTYSKRPSKYTPLFFSIVSGSFGISSAKLNKISSE